MSVRAWVLAWIGVMVGSGCAEPKSSGSVPPQDDGAATSTADRRSTRADCLPGGPSVSVNVSRESGGNLSREELGALLGWIGGFVQPCIDEPSQAHHFTLVFEIGPPGEAPTLALVEQETLPSMAACLDEGFARAPAPPPEEMRVSIVVPWGCPTLGPGFQGSPAPGEGSAGEGSADEGATAEAPAVP